MTASFAIHTPYSDPGPHAALLRDLPADPRQAAHHLRGLTLHYAASPNVPAGRELDRQTRWVCDILDLLVKRSAAPFTEPRPPEARFVGCCRDDALLLAATLRQHGVPARIRVGFVEYLMPGFHNDHVITEWFDGARWVRGDPELIPEHFPFDTMDLPPGTFQTAGEAWLAYRAGTLDAARYGVAPGLFGGPVMLREYVLRELAALTEHELLLWDNWGLMKGLMDSGSQELSPEQFALLDEVAQALGREEPERWQALAHHPELQVPDTVQTYTFQGDQYAFTSLQR